ncbi:sensor histidine kinase [Methylobacterium frigidaeris]|uniref:histidine kinase n=1 Tax=Methylobacterium frigidaeris TaxID=2038277 RepID=A0AA37HD08_9HYPH|nr:HAMP domain-containing sensor histidine kinase [Methylobacterium frigidaeris]PIK71744.1 two-component sensor histidine kinase [Methylobacterium frigidaeris]GJD63539.1 Alkaline phosphatase synthesis sensor protein PhoR [Methylobacterium frigidaeris]
MSGPEARIDAIPPAGPAGLDGSADLGDETAALRREVAALRRALAERDAFLAGVAHELRNPMTPILGQVERLTGAAAREAPEGRVAQGLAQLRWLVERYVRRATTLLDVSRAQTGQLALLAAPVPLAEVVEEVVASLSPMAAHAGSTVTVAVPDDLVLSCERLALDQILDNLVTNAIKYGDGGAIAVSATREAGTARIRVSDRGIGIAETDQARIFERFERAVGDPSTAPVGFGVGLWLVRRLAEAMGGGVALDSRPGEGATFTVTLPLHA